MPKRIVKRAAPAAEEEERPKGRFRRVPPAEEAKTPRRVPRAKQDYDEDPTDEPDDTEEEEDEGGAKNRRGKAVRSGWAGAKQTKAASGDFPEEFKASDEAVLIKFLEDEPFASYRQHWIERPGKKSWTCLEDNCPLCDIGDRPAAKIAFNILSFENPDEPENKVWIVGTKLSGALENFASDKKTGPLTRLYWSVKRTGKGTKSQTHLTPIKERDLKDDWDVEPLSEEELDTAYESCFDDTVIQVQTRKQLKDVASDLDDEEEA